MVYLDRHPEVVAKADYVAWEYMSGGLSRLNKWAGEYVFPTRRPFYATWYVIRRYVLPKFMTFFNVNELPPTGNPDAVNIETFEIHVGSLARATGRSHPGVIWLYPSAGQLADARQGLEWLSERSQNSENRG